MKDHEIISSYLSEMKKEIEKMPEMQFSVSFLDIIRDEIQCPLNEGKREMLTSLIDQFQDLLDVSLLKE